MGAKKQLSKHPNPYTLADEFRNQLVEGSDTVIAETNTNKKKKENPNMTKLRNRRNGLMKYLKKRNIDLDSYMVQMGGSSLKYQPKVRSDPDPDPLGLGELRFMSDDTDNEDPASEEESEEAMADITLDETCSTEEAQENILLTPPPVTPVPTKPASRRQKKGKRKKQAPVANSEDSFIHVEGQDELQSRVGASIGGDDLRQNRRREEEREESSDMFASALSAAAVASAGITVLSRFSSRSSARRSSVGRRTSVGRRPSRTSSLLPDSISSDPFLEAKKRVKSLGFRFSSTQPRTKGDGNCMLHAILDQLKKIGHPIIEKVRKPHELRLFICSNLRKQLDENKLFWVTDISPELWLEKMKTNGYWCDDVFLQITANILDINMILIPLSPSSSHHAGMYTDIRSIDGGSGQPFYMLYFEEWR